MNINTFKNINSIHAFLRNIGIVVVADDYSPKLRHKKVKYGSVEKTTVSGMYDSKGGYITNNIQQIINIINTGNINKLAIPSIRLLPILSLLLSEGCCITDSLFLLNQPIIKKYIELIKIDGNYSDDIYYEVIDMFEFSKTGDFEKTEYFEMENTNGTGLETMIKEWVKVKDNGKKNSFDGENKMEQYKAQLQIFVEVLKQDKVANEYFFLFSDAISIFIPGTENNILNKLNKSDIFYKL